MFRSPSLNGATLALILGLAVLSLIPMNAQETPVKKILPHIVLVGDSTVTDKDGWGAGFRRFISDDAKVTNTATGGRSTKSFIEEGRWAKAIALRGDYYLIQFGHNDEKPAPELHTDPETTFAANLARFVDEVRAAGGQPILLTSLTRRVFDAKKPGKIRSTLIPYAEAAKKVATDKKVPLIDLHALSIAYCEKIGQEETDKLNPLTANGNQDRTHLGPPGSLVFGQIVAVMLGRAVPTLRHYVLEEAKPEPAAAK